MEHIGIIKETVAYKIVKNDYIGSALSHAYLLQTSDKKYLREYLKIFANLIMLGEVSDSRESKLIAKEVYADVKFYPTEPGKRLSVADIAEIVADSYIKPYEADKKLYVLEVSEPMNDESQNKLLKTLEEPPANTYILLGALNEYALLPTIKSRVKKLTIPSFTDKEIYKELEKTCLNKEKLNLAIAASSGTLGGAENLYDDKNLESLIDLAAEVINNLNSSENVLEYSEKILALKDKTDEFLDCYELLYKDMLMKYTCGEKYVQNIAALKKINGKNGYNNASIIAAIESVGEARKRRNFNANDSMVISYLLFKVLEGRYKWQKL